eukprot:CAMPEP_0182445660 /NCGR_PEP_ID=MMETSP1172-20130603/3714_1 /TAXON_ID=708627 /ORGANISM="Timspurckia oligopyrenoides, Strain CCMP3278" /LENGTH=558 /DNA_ID=CAMNT_0024641471 /DNA_START=37 /DNA_END=1713 /DNA_ORIENTATION=+
MVNIGRLVVALAVVSAVLSCVVLGVPTVGGPTYQRPQELSIGSTDLHPVPGIGGGFGQALSGGNGFFGGTGGSYVTGRESSSLNNPFELPTPNGATASLGRSVTVAQVAKVNAPDGDLSGTQFNNFQWYFVIDNARLYTYASIQIDRNNASNPDQVTGNSNGGLADIEVVNSLTPPASAGIPLRQVITGRQSRVNADGGCVYTDVIVTGSSENNGFFAVFTYDGRVPFDEVGGFSLRFRTPSNVDGFGWSAESLSSEVFAVGSNVGRSVFIYETTDVDNGDCTYGYDQAVSITNNVPSFGYSISIVSGHIAVGAPLSGNFGRAYIYSYNRAAGTSSLLQTVEAPVSDAFGITQQNGQRFGAAVALAGPTNFLFVGSPEFGAKGQVFYFQFSEATGFLEFEFPFDIEAVPNGVGFGEKIVVNCKTVTVGTDSGSIVTVTNFDIGAFFDDYCTCVAAERPMLFASLVDGTESDNPFIDGTSGTCVSVVSSSFRACELSGAGSICNYLAEPAWFFDDQPNPPPVDLTASCTWFAGDSAHLNRRNFAPNCFYDYGEIGVPEV